MRNINFKLSILTVALATTLTACGGGSSNDESPMTSVSGRAIDGALNGATVTFDDCNKQTTKTDDKGFFSFPAGCTESSLSISGGIDTGTDLAFTGHLKAPKVTAQAGAQNQVIASPLTTLVAAAGGADKAAALLKALGLEGVDLMRTDPLTNKDLYQKTVAVQQLVEQIEKAIHSVGGGISAESLSTAAFSALTTALLANTGNAANALQDANLISAALSGTLENVKADLPADVREHLADVKANLSALTATTIAANIAAVETAIAKTTFNPSADNSAAIKAATKEAIVAAKESQATENLTSALAETLILPASQVQTLLAAIGTASSSGVSNAADVIGTQLEKLQEVATANGVSFEVPQDLAKELANPDEFTQNYFKLDGFTVGTTSYTSTELGKSLTTPLQVTSLNNLLVGMTAFGTQQNTHPTVSAGLKIVTATKSLAITADKVNLSFNTAGALTAANIPSGATLKVTSNVAGVGNSTITAVNSVNAFSNGKIALNATTLASLSPSLATQLSQAKLTGETATVTAVVNAEGAVIAVDNASNKPSNAARYSVDGITSSGVSAKFTVTQ